MTNRILLGATEDANAKAWSTALSAMRAGVNSSWSSAKQAYLALKKTRESFGLPFIEDVVKSGGEGQPVTQPSPWDVSSWSSELDQLIVDIQAMVGVLDKAAADVLAGKRALMWDEGQGNFGIEGRPDDQLRIEMVNGGPILVDSQGKQVHGSGTLGIAPIIWVAAGVAVVQTVAVYFIVESSCEAIKAVAEQKTMRTIAEENAKLVQSGKATPEQTAAMTDAVYGGASKLEAAKTQTKKEDSKLADTVTTVAYVGLGIAIVYTLAQFVGKMPSRAPAAAYSENPNPKVRSGYGYEAPITQGLRGEDWRLGSSEDWDIVILSTGRYPYLGTRIIDDVKVNVWRDARRKRYIAQQAFGS